MRQFVAALIMTAAALLCAPASGLAGRVPSTGAPESPWWPPPGVTTGDLVRRGTLQLMGDFTTHYPHSPKDRNYNLALAARKLCGTVVPPGATFSFNGRAGEASYANGFRRAGVFIGDRVVQGEGGGVCQVVSTLYNAVVEAGLPTLEARRHSMVVPYLPPGQDATIAWGFIDFTFVNDTPGPILILAAASGPDVRTAIYGDVGGVEVNWDHDIARRVRPYTVRIPSPGLIPGEERVRDPGQWGLAVSTTYTQLGRFGERTVRRGGHFYQPRPRIVEVGGRRA